MRRFACWLVFGSMVVGLLDGCGKKRPPHVVIVAFFDVSGSTVAVRSRYKSEFQAIIDQVKNDTRSILVMADRITANTEATSQFPVKVRFEASAGMLGNPLKEKKQRETQAQRVQNTMDAMLQKSEPASDIMSAFRCAGKVFANHKEANHKVFIIFSDMIEQSSKYNFYSMKLDQKQIQQIIQQEESQGRIPDLAGVQVWIVGFAAAEKGGLPPSKIKEIEDFWIAYLQAAKADADRNRISQTLVGFELPQD